MESCRRTAEFWLNRPGVEELREIDEQAYVTLTIQSWQRGFPFLPSRDQESTVTIAAGEALGLTGWTRFCPAMVGDEKFRFSNYLQLFLDNLGVRVRVFDSLDGRLLVPYQCVMQREDWVQIKSGFLEAFSLQKTAYRHANGGTTAPNVHDNSKSRFVPRASCETLNKRIEMALKKSSQHKVIVRHTFVEVQSPHHDEDPDAEPPAERHYRRPKTDSSLQVRDDSVLSR